jgi:hypothetical protein
MAVSTGGRVLGAGRAAYPDRSARGAAPLRVLGLQFGERGAPGDRRRRLPARYKGQSAKELDPAYDGEPQDYDYAARRQDFHLSPRLGKISTGGNIGRPLITIHGTMDTLLPLTRHARPFRDGVVAAGKGDLHRLYEVQNGNHIERYRQSCSVKKKLSVPLLVDA